MENKERKMESIKDANFIKFETKGQVLSGKFFSIEEAKNSKFTNSKSYSLSLIKEDNEIYSVFVTDIAFKKIQMGDIKKGQFMEIEYLGLESTKDGKLKYHNYDIRKEVQ